jgi:hypothetical protein
MSDAIERSSRSEGNLDAELLFDVPYPGNVRKHAVDREAEQVTFDGLKAWMSLGRR